MLHGISDKTDSMDPVDKTFAQNNLTLNKNYLSIDKIHIPFGPDIQTIDGWRQTLNISCLTSGPNHQTECRNNQAESEIHRTESQNNQGESEICQTECPIDKTQCGAWQMECQNNQRESEMVCQEAY
jgi:hypothetical protein